MSGQEPTHEAGKNHYPSSTANTSRSPQNSNTPITARSSSSTTSHTSPSGLSEEELARLPPIFHRKTHQQCLEMEANRLVAPDGGRGRMAMNALRDDMFDAIFQFLFLIGYLIGSVMIAGFVLGTLAFFIGLPVYLAYRHRVLVSRRSKYSVSSATARKRLNEPELLFFMFIMGSGGHSSEMLSMIESSIDTEIGMFRRYIVNEEDVMTRERIIALEDRIGRRFARINANPGVFDIMEIKRARMVHQSWLSTPISAAKSIWSILQAIFAMDGIAMDAGTDPDWRFPGAVATNGPGTGFLFLAIIHLLKMVRFLPENRFNTMFVESFARVRSLSFTGKLIHWTNVADVFVVQHEKLAHRYGKILCRDLVATPAEPPVPFLDEE
ncbi:hypothetical protein DL764_007472 [Monosporascus ibericus]|uniref:UDP-N-acetylglucosamine transferase subunit ALG14 n=1 Tax=Monosporascus ibericus TaxID=155417 RepID=A0A4Q4T396_9PEZI|nr:hypothetical protein DL764_007472 [Monosporascus ibericus]